MSESTGEKTEQPTDKRLRDARKKGQVAKSKEIASASGIISILSMIWLAWQFFILPNLKKLLLIPSLYFHLPFKEALAHVLNHIGMTTVLIIAPFLGVVIVFNIMAYILQFGFIFTMDPIKPDLNKIHPKEGLKKIFALNNLIEFLKSLVKIIFLGMMIYYVIKGAIDPLTKIPLTGFTGLSYILSSILFQIYVFTVFAFITIAILDFFFQKFLHIRNNRMTKDEVKREFKEMEGDPFIKGKRRQLQMEMQMNTMMSNVKKASVIITNPVHLAVALYYKKDETSLPLVLAKGQDLIAQQIVKIAREENIPIMRNIPLAHDLYRNVDVDEFIPRDLIKPVAEVIRWVQKIDAERKKS